MNRHLFMPQRSFRVVLSPFVRLQDNPMDCEQEFVSHYDSSLNCRTGVYRCITPIANTN
jgi:hypothetical protein